uniref:YdeI/OmpD-associated family protein n=1 Tax=Cellulomonas telluris TaxID=2306636 RepID=UPI001CA3E5F9
VAVARESGMWTLMDDVEDCVVPDDLAAAFDRFPGARDHWESWSASAQKLILTWIVLAKRPETRATRVTTTAEKAARGEKSQ